MAGLLWKGGRTVIRLASARRPLQSVKLQRNTRPLAKVFKIGQKVILFLLTWDSET